MLRECLGVEHRGDVVRGEEALVVLEYGELEFVDATVGRVDLPEVAGPRSVVV